VCYKNESNMLYFISKISLPNISVIFMPIFNRNWEVMPWFYLKVLIRGKKLWLKKVVPSKTLTSESKQTNQNNEKYLRASVICCQQFCPLLLLQYLSVIFCNSNSLIEDSRGETSSKDLLKTWILTIWAKNKNQSSKNIVRNF
jgi:hypothetical protein